MMSDDLFQAITAGNLKKVHKYIVKKGNLNVIDHYRTKYTPLMYAVMRGSRSIASLLLESGANINQKDADDKTAYRFALEYGREDIIELFLSFGADVNHTSPGHFREWTPLCIVANLNYTEALALLLKHGADPNAPQSYDLNTPIYFSAAQNNSNNMSLLLHFGAHLNQINRDGASPLMRAVQNHAEESIRICMEHDIDIRPIFSQESAVQNAFYYPKLVAHIQDRLPTLSKEHQKIWKKYRLQSLFLQDEKIRSE